MNAFLFDRHGGPELLHLAEVPDPIAGPGEIRVLPNVWHATDEWRTQAGRTRGGDTRRPRDETPQFQHEADRQAALASGALVGR